MSKPTRIGRRMRDILVVLYATQQAHVTTAQLAKAIEASLPATRHSAAALVRNQLIRNQGSEHLADWRITNAGLYALNALWAKEGGGASH